MDFRIATVISKMHIVPQGGFVINSKPNRGYCVKQNKKAVKVQIARVKSGLRKVFAQKPDEFVLQQASQTEIIPKRLKRLAKLPKHKRVKNVLIQTKQKTIKQSSFLEQDIQNISPQFLSEEDKKWINFALRNHNTAYDYKPLEEHYRPEIENMDISSKIKQNEEGYAKATEAKTKVYLVDIKEDEEYRNKLYWRDIIPKSDKKGIIVNLNNRLKLMNF